LYILNKSPAKYLLHPHRYRHESPPLHSSLRDL
jgi:hypothetical protein